MTLGIGMHVDIFSGTGQNMGEGVIRQIDGRTVRLWSIENGRYLELSNKFDLNGGDKRQVRHMPRVWNYFKVREK